MLEIVHLYQWQKFKKDPQSSRDTKEGWFTKVPNTIPYEFEEVVKKNPFKLAMFIIPQNTRTRGGFIAWNHAEKLPKKGIHLSTLPMQRNERTRNLLRSTRGMLLFTHQYDPEWFRKDEDTAYFLGFNERRLLTYYSKHALIADLIFKGNLPAEYDAGLEDAAFKI